MRDPREDGHVEVGCSCDPDMDNGAACFTRCVLCDDDEWPCAAVREYDKAKRAAQLTDELDALRDTVDELRATVERQGRALVAHERFFAGAVMPVIRDLLATHATGSLSMPADWWNSDVRHDAAIGSGVQFVGSDVFAYYVYEATDGRVYTNGKVSKGADLDRVTEQMKRFK
jgi:hypothetical protein